MKELNEAFIKTLAGEAAFRRGLAYFREGRVGSLHQHGNTITADVEGTSTWQVALKHTAAVFEGTCDCPASDHFDFCKHCVATALKYSRHLGKLGRLRESNATDRLPAYLMTLDKKELADSLLELLESDRQLHLRLQWPLLDQAIKEKDIETEIELRAKTAVDSGDFLSISQLCLQNNLLDQAIDWHNRATNSDSRAHGRQLQIENSQIQIWLRQNKQAEVLQLLWKRFKKSFAVPVYKHIVEVSCDTSDETDNFARAAALLQKEIDSSNQFRSQKATDALANLHIFHQQFEEALLMAEQGTLDPHLLLEISRANRQFPERVLPLLFRVADYHVRQGRNNEYRQAIEIIKEAHEIAGLDYQQQFAVQLSRIRLTNKPKRNFQKWLGEAFSQLL